MWISEYIAGRSFGKESASKGEISAAANGSVSVSATRDYHGIPTVSPGGFAYMPVTGEKTVVISGEDGAMCLGVFAQPSEHLQPGELMLYSAGGASIVLKNDGRVLINGRAVS